MKTTRTLLIIPILTLTLLGCQHKTNTQPPTPPPQQTTNQPSPLEGKTTTINPTRPQLKPNCGNDCKPGKCN